MFKALTLKTIHGRQIYHTWVETEKLVADGKIDVKKVITSRFPMSRYEDAFKALFEGKDCKIVLYPSQWLEHTSHVSTSLIRGTMWRIYDEPDECYKNLYSINTNK